MIDSESKPLSELLRGSPYQGYAYSYPHKHAYRHFPEPKRLADVWKYEDKRALFLYFHIPFCEMRCGFCNLFTQSHSRSGLKQEIEDAYLSALDREVCTTKTSLGEARFSRGAIGGGTPTFLSLGGMQRLLDLFTSFAGHGNPLSVEASPFTATPERLWLLAKAGVSRISIGVQSFVDAEVCASGRAQSRIEVEQALDAIRGMGFPELNIDLIYGLPGQSLESWIESLKCALSWRPEELFLYPLYIRPLTGLARKENPASSDASWDELRKTCYRAGRDYLLSRGYQQMSMRHFRRVELNADAGDYCCQRDGMIGIGSGARSYTRSIHYSSEYAVGRSGVSEIVDGYTKRPENDFECVRYGFVLDENEQRRRVLIKSLLHRSGLDLSLYARMFQSPVLSDFPELYELQAAHMLESQSDRITLTPLGMEYSDVIGPWIASRNVRQSMRGFVLR